MLYLRMKPAPRGCHARMPNPNMFAILKNLPGAEDYEALFEQAPAEDGPVRYITPLKPSKRHTPQKTAEPQDVWTDTRTNLEKHLATSGYQEYEPGVETIWLIRGLSTRAARSLARGNIKTDEEIRSSFHQLSIIPYCGKVIIEEIANLIGYTEPQDVWTKFKKTIAAAKMRPGTLSQKEMINIMAKFGA